MKVVLGLAVGVLVGLPFIGIIAIAVMAGAMTGAATNAISVAAVACTYSNPQPQPLLTAVVEVHPMLFRDDDHRADIAARFGLEQLDETGGIAQARMPLIAIGLSLHTVTDGTGSAPN